MSSKSAPSSKSNKAIRIRMYRVGFGDCFLLSFPVPNAEDGYKHFVIDCGVHAQGNIDTIDDAVENIAAMTGKRIAAVIATHSHQDHISGFSDKFSDFQIEEVWMPWADDPNDELAKKWSKKQAALVSQLEQHFAAQARMGAADSKTKARKDALAAVANLTPNAKAMRLLRGGFNTGAKVQYFEGGKSLNNAADVTGLEVRFLSPPRDPKFLAKMDPPQGQRWLRLGDGDTIQTNNLTQPFAKKWLRPGDPPLSEEERKRLQKDLNDTSLDSLAFALDNAKNNTSLVTLFIYRGQYLLFPGDAQYGNWQYWLEKEEAEEILERITFLKVGHHGSHNATPREVVDRLKSDSLSAMVSTQSVPWDSIPKVPMMEKLDVQAKKRMVRSDWIDIKGAPGPLPKSAPQKPNKLPTGFSEGDFWYDLVIPLG